MPSDALQEAPLTTSVPAAPPVFVTRFTATERWLHWVHTGGFLAMLATGLLLYLPGLTGALGSRPTVKAAHLVAVAAWLAGLLLVTVLGNRRALLRTAREIERFDPDDIAWLRHGRRARQGRFNAGQKLHTVIQVGFAVLFVVSGTLLWLGERNNDLRLSGTITVHDGAMFLAVGLLLGHLWLALVWPPTRHAMRGITRGTVRADWAARHHAKWATGDAGPSATSRPGRVAVALGVLVVAAGGWGALALANDATDGRGSVSPTTPVPAAAVATTAPGAPVPQVPTIDPAAPPLQLAAEAQQLEQAGEDDAALERYRLAVRGLPDRGDIRTAFGLALARTGNAADAVLQLRRAVRARPVVPESRMYLGAVLLRAGQTTEGRRQLRRYLRANPSGDAATYAKSLLAGG